MRFAFVCDTPYQVLNTLSMYWHCYREDKEIQADLFVVDQFAGAKELYEGICKENLFDNVYLLRREENRFLPRGLKRSIRVAYSYWNPKHAIRNQIDSVSPETFMNRYDVIHASLVKCITSALIKLNPKAVFYLLEDGTGSYFGDLVAMGGGLPYRIFSFIFRSGANAARAKKLYVYDVDSCYGTAADEICALPKISEEFLQIAYRIFGIEKQENRNGIIYLSQPFEMKGDIEIQVPLILERIKPWADKTLVRMHPRDFAYEFYSAFEVDDKRQMWELVISQTDMDNIILIGNYSTAQITPKVLYDKEPWLIFTYNIMNVFSQEDNEMVAVQIEQMKKNYRSKDRILVPKTFEEFSECLDRAMAAIQA